MKDSGALPELMGSDFLFNQTTVIWLYCTYLAFRSNKYGTYLFDLCNMYFNWSQLFDDSLIHCKLQKVTNTLLAFNGNYPVITTYILYLLKM